jgi:hypothetical protein
MSKELELVEGRIVEVQKGIDEYDLVIGEMLSQRRAGEDESEEIHQRRMGRSNLKRELAELDRQRRQIQDRQDAEERARYEVELREAAQGADFWFRRFMLSLQIGNGAAFLAVVTSVVGADQMAQAAKWAILPAMGFGVGAIFSGMLPMLLWVQRVQMLAGVRPLFRSLTASFAIVGAVAFFAGMTGVIWGLQEAAGQPHPWSDAARAAAR